MNSRSRLWLSIGIPVLLIIIVVGAFLWQQRAAVSSVQPTQRPVTTPGSQCASLGKSTPQQFTNMNLALDWTPNTNHTGIYVALAQNWYRAEGIDLHLLPYSAKVSPAVLVRSGRAVVGGSATERIVTDAAVGQPVVSLAAIIQHNTSALVTLASSGLTRPRDLDGKIYGGFGAPYESAELTFTTIFLDDLTHYRCFVRSAKTTINFAVQVAWPRESRTRQSDKCRSVMLNNRGERNYRLSHGCICYDALGRAYANISLATTHQHIRRHVSRIGQQVQINSLCSIPVLCQCDVNTCMVRVGCPV